MVQDQLSETFSALADPTRRAILARLAEGETTVSELARPFSMSLPAVSKHLRVLERCGLITQKRVGVSRPCRLQAEKLTEATEWLDRYREFWEESFSRLDEHLKVMQSKAVSNKTTKKSVQKGTKK